MKELDDKKELVSEYVIELNKLNNEHEKERQEIAKELNDKGILLNKSNRLNNEHEQKYKY